MQLEKVLAGLDFERRGPCTEILGLAYDSRLVRPGDLFAAIRGFQRDGHDYVRDAQLKGGGGRGRRTLDPPRFRAAPPNQSKRCPAGPEPDERQFLRPSQWKITGFGCDGYERQDDQHLFYQIDFRGRRPQRGCKSGQFRYLWAGGGAGGFSHHTRGLGSPANAGRDG